jgi:prolyl oligopeptidase
LGIEAKEFPIAFVDESYPDYVLGVVATVQQEFRMFYAPVSQLKSPKIEWQALCQPSDNLVRGLELHGGHIYAVTHAGAPKYKVLRTSVKKPDWKHAETVIPEAKDSIRYITKTRDYLLVVYSDGIVGRVAKYHFGTGKVADLTLPFSGAADVMCPNKKQNRFFLNIESWTTPLTIYDVDLDKETMVKSIFNTDVVYPGFENLVSEEVEVASHDGTAVPLSIIHRKDMKLDGSNSCILEGYGAWVQLYAAL